MYALAPDFHTLYRARQARGKAHRQNGAGVFDFSSSSNFFLGGAVQWAGFAFFLFFLSFRARDGQVDGLIFVV